MIKFRHLELPLLKQIACPRLSPGFSVDIVCFLHDCSKRVIGEQLHLVQAIDIVCAFVSAVELERGVHLLLAIQNLFCWVEEVKWLLVQLVYRAAHATKRPFLKFACEAFIL